MSEQAQLIETFAEGVTTLTMNRPDARNAMTGEMIQGLLEALPRLAQDPAVRCVVLTGAGGAFCAGGDVKGLHPVAVVVVKRRVKKSVPRACAGV